MNEKQSAFLTLYVIVCLICFFLSESILFRPLRLLTTFVHEFSHALACWFTCGSVRGIEVHSNAGGVTKYVGGCRCIITSAGYLGEAFWGMVFVIASGGVKTATFAAAGLLIALLTSLCYAPNRTMVFLNAFYIILISICIYIEYRVFSPILPYVVLFYGVFFQYFAITDIYHHTVLRSHRDSDAFVLYEESGRCCPPKCIGAFWLILALTMQLIGVLMGIILMSDECEQAGWFECIFHTKFDFDFNTLFSDWAFDFH